MIAWAVAALILSAPPAAHSEPPPADGHARRVTFACDFEHAQDADYDLWPDDWTRVRDRRYPSFVEVRIQPEEGVQRFGEGAPPGNRVLRMELDGSNASLTSPFIAVRRLQTYELTFDVRGRKATDKIVTASLSFHDAAKRSLGRQRSVSYPRPDDEWTTISLPDVEIDDQETHFVRIHLSTDSTGRFVKGGSIDFDRVELAEFPQVKLETDRNPNLYGPGETPTLTCSMSALDQAMTVAEFRLFDRRGHEVAARTLPLEGENAFDPSAFGEDPEASPRATDDGHEAERHSTEPHGQESHGASADVEHESPRSVRRAVAVWTPPLPGPGHYVVEVRCRPAGPEEHAAGDATPRATFERRVALVSLPALPPAPGGSFGWSLSSLASPISTRTIARLAPDLGVQWIRAPIWYDHEDSRAENELADFLERLSAQNVQLIGALDRPPERFRAAFASGDDVPIARAISDKALWEPALAPILPRTALKIQRWQLGADEDYSLTGFADRRRAIADIRAELIRFNRQARVGVPWNWIHDPPDDADEIDFLSYGTSPSLTAEELDFQLTKANESASPSIVARLEPLPADVYSDDVRARDLMERMIQTRRHETLAALLPDPFATGRGLFTETGEPTPMLLPWRTTALHLGTAKRVGSLSLGCEATNHVFLREDDAVFVAWREKPTEETLFLGASPSAMDLWGNEVSLRRVGDEHVVPIGPTPIFVSGLHPGIAAWRARFRLIDRDLESVPGTSRSLTWSATNPFSVGAGGTMRIEAPELFAEPAVSRPFRLAPGEAFQGALAFQLGRQANGGAQTVRIDFDISADRQYRFSTYEKVFVGLKDVRIDFRSALDASGTLVVEQEFVNLGTTPVSYDFYLYAPDRKRKRQQLRECGPGSYKLEYYFPDGASLIGKELWLRAEAADGLRALNYRFTPRRDEE